MEIENLQNSLDNSVVTAPIAGIIKQINNTSDGSSSGAYMTILMNGSYRVKCRVDEMNVRSLSEGMKAVVYSRVIKDKTWNGTISKVDSSNPADNSNNMMNAGNADNAATNYYFYVTLESSDELLLGEHVYVEPVTEDEPAVDTDEPAAQDADAAPAEKAEN